MPDANQRNLQTWPSTMAIHYGTICIIFLGPKKKASSATSVKSSAPPVSYGQLGGRYESSQAERQDKQPNLGPQLISCLWLRSVHWEIKALVPGVVPSWRFTVCQSSESALSLGVSLRGGNFDFFGSKGTSCIFFSRYLATGPTPIMAVKGSRDDLCMFQNQLPQKLHGLGMICVCFKINYPKNCMV